MTSAEPVHDKKTSQLDKLFGDLVELDGATAEARRERGTAHGGAVGDDDLADARTRERDRHLLADVARAEHEDPPALRANPSRSTATETAAEGTDTA